MDKEIWKDIDGFEGLYKIGSNGNVYSVRRNKLLKPNKDNSGYIHIVLSKNNNIKSFLIHRLVAMAFIPNPNNYKEVNHKDENKTNNFVFVNDDGSIDLEKSNLEWCDRDYNIKYGTCINRIKQSHKWQTKPCAAYKDGVEVMRFNSTMEAQRNGYCGIHISQCCRGIRKTHKGYEWKWVAHNTQPT